MTRHGPWTRGCKRALDLVGAGGGLLVLSPLLLVVSLVILATMGRPVLFVQPRPGRDGKPFPLRKFRTMRAALDDSGRALPDVARLTRLGCFLRATSIDELPELWNVFRGDMSLVGPRPWLMDYLPHYTQEQRRRHEVRPGITGWAQINGRNAASWDERLRLDVWYVDHWSLWLDFRILVRTAWTVVRREGISAAGHATMPRFDHPPAANPEGGAAEPVQTDSDPPPATAETLPPTSPEPR